MFRSPSALFLVLAFVTLSGCTELYNDPYPPSYGGGYNSGGYPGYGTGYDDYHRRRDWERRRANERERERLEDEREELDAERRRLSEKRRRLEEHEQNHHQPSIAPPQPPAKCPPGFHPTTGRCSDKERKKGCKDIRVNSDLVCINK